MLPLLTEDVFDVINIIDYSYSNQESYHYLEYFYIIKINLYINMIS